MNFSKLCSPALLYLVLSAISIFIAFFHKFQIMTLVVKTVFVLLWTWFLNFLCSKGHTGISWFLVLLPFILMILMFVFALEVVKKFGAQTMAMMQPPQKARRAMN